MGRFSKINKIFRRDKSGAKSAPVVPGDSIWPWDPDSEVTNPLKIATVYRCIRLLSESVANLPLRMLRRSPEGISVPDEGSELAYLLDVEPRENQNSYDFKKQIVQQLLCFGNAYIIPEYREHWTGKEVRRQYERLNLCSPLTCEFDEINRVYRVYDPVTGIKGVYLPEEVIHLRGMSRDGVRGVSVLEFARLSTTIAAYGDKETRDRFKNGGNVRGFLTNQSEGVQGFNKYADKALKAAAEQREDFFNKLGGKISYIPGNMQFKELMMSSADMQFLESRKFTVRELCRFFGVHPSFVFDDTSNNYKSAEMANVAFLSNTLNPLLCQIESEFRIKLLPRHERAAVRFEFDRHSLFACDLETRVKWQQARIGAGLDTLNEARLLENRPPVEDGDTPLVSANLKGLKQIISE